MAKESRRQNEEKHSDLSRMSNKRVIEMTSHAICQMINSKIYIVNVIDILESNKFYIISYIYRNI